MACASISLTKRAAKIVNISGYYLLKNFCKIDRYLLFKNYVLIIFFAMGNDHVIIFLAGYEIIVASAFPLILS